MSSLVSSMHGVIEVGVGLACGVVILFALFRALHIVGCIVWSIFVRVGLLFFFLVDVFAKLYQAALGIMVCVIAVLVAWYCMTSESHLSAVQGVLSVAFPRISSALSFIASTVASSDTKVISDAFGHISWFGNATATQLYWAKDAVLMPFVRNVTAHFTK